MCVAIPFILDVRLWTYQPGSHRRKVTQGFHDLLSAVIALIFLARKIQPFLSLVEREVGFCVLTIYIIVLHVLSIFFFFVRKKNSSCDDTKIRTHVPTPEGFEVTN